MQKCCQGVREVCKLSVLGQWPGFDLLVLEFFSRARVLCGWIKEYSYLHTGFKDLSPDLDIIYFDCHHWRTYLPVLTP